MSESGEGSQTTNLLLGLILAVLLFGSSAVLGFVEIAVWGLLALFALAVAWFIVKSILSGILGAGWTLACGLGAVAREAWEIAVLVWRRPGRAMRLGSRALVRIGLIVAFGPLFYVRRAWRDIRTQTDPVHVAASGIVHLGLLLMLTGAYALALTVATGAVLAMLQPG